jgi:oligopeptide/dipeptide ABC transporter ATP-binding protein
MGENLLEVVALKKYFPIQAGLLKRTVGYIKAVDEVSLSLRRGETVGIVGESGCGKSTLGRTIIRIYDPTEGTIFFDGQDITKLKGKALRSIRKNVQMIFQDPYASLNPKMKVLEAISEPLWVNGLMERKEAEAKAVELLIQVGLREGDSKKYPFEFSGGQRQRIGIARALSLNPKFIIADEAVSSLDVSIQSQILNLLSDLKDEFSLSYMFISHNLAVVRHISDRVGVMYLGKLVEMADKQSLYTHALHPYTQALLSAAPVARKNRTREKIILQGDVPSPAKPPQGCPFHPRCRQCMDICKEQRPLQVEIENGHEVACHLYNNQGQP